MGLCCCMCRQQKKTNHHKISKDENVDAFTNNGSSHSRSTRHTHSHNNSNDSLRLRYLVLAYEDGRKIKIPFDLATLDRLGDENVAILNQSNHGSNNINLHDTTNKIGHKLSSNTRVSSSNYLSDSLHAALSDENNKIVSAVLMDSNNEDLENSNQENTTIHPLTLDHLDVIDNINGMDGPSNNNHSPIDIIMEDDADLRLGNNRYLISDDDTLISPNVNTKLIKIGTENLRVSYKAVFLLQTRWNSDTKNIKQGKTVNVIYILMIIKIQN